MVKIIETPAGESPDQYEQRYALSLGGKAIMHFVRRPVAIEPPEGKIFFVDNGPRQGTIPRYSAATWSNGKWDKVKFEPTHWTQWDD